MSGEWPRQHMANPFVADPRVVLYYDELLVSRDLTPDERGAHDADPRPGWWRTHDNVWERLDQTQTDMLISTELQRYQVHMRSLDEVRELHALLGDTVVIDMPHGQRVSWSRGGVSSDPMARVLAWRAWGPSVLVFANIRARAETLRKELGLLTWDAQADWAHGALSGLRYPFDYRRRRSGRTTRIILDAIAELDVTGKRHLAFDAVSLARRRNIYEMGVALLSEMARPFTWIDSSTRLPSHGIYVLHYSQTRPRDEMLARNRRFVLAEDHP